MIIDTAPAYNDINLKVLAESDLILLVLNQDLTALRHTKTALDIFNTFNYMPKVRLVLNQYGKEGLKLGDIEKVLKLSITAMVPEDAATVKNSINKGMPFVISQRQGKMTLSISEMAKKTWAFGKAEELENSLIINQFCKAFFNKRSTSLGS